MTQVSGSADLVPTSVAAAADLGWVSDSRRAVVRLPVPLAGRVGVRVPLPVAVSVAAAALSVASWAVYAQQNLILADGDTVSHMLIARRVIDAVTPGIGQLGAVWLPLPHLLMLPFVWIDELYYSGMAGSIVSMLAYVGATLLLFLTARELTGRIHAGVAAAAVFMLNPNVLYLQATPMTEMLLYLSVAAATYGLVRYHRTQSTLALVGTAGAVFLGSLTRYEAWVLGVGVSLVLAKIVWERRASRVEVESRLVAYATLAGAGVAAWGLWNHLLHGDVLYFQQGEYAQPSLWVTAQEVAAGDLTLATKTFAYAIFHTVGWPVLVFAAVALALFILRDEVRTEAVAVVPLLWMPVFFVLMIYDAQRPLHVMEVVGGLYNVRYGLIMILPTALLIGWLVAQARGTLLTATATVLAGVVLGFGVQAWSDGAVTANEARGRLASEAGTVTADTAAWLRRHHDGGLTLMESFGNEGLLFHGRLDNGSVINEGTYRRWEPALADPRGAGIAWVVMSRATWGSAGGGGDRVWRAFDGGEDLTGYELVYEDIDRRIYRRQPITASGVRS